LLLDPQQIIEPIEAEYHHIRKCPFYQSTQDLAGADLDKPLHPQISELCQCVDPQYR